MMIWLLPLVPLLAGPALWAFAAAGRTTSAEAGPSRTVLGALAVGALTVTLGLAVAMAVTRPEGRYAVGAGLVLRAELDATAAVMAVLVPAVAVCVALWAAGHEEAQGLGRLLGIMVAFVGAMELLVVAADLLTLLVGWELVGAASWALIGHHWREPDKPAAAAHAFIATRFGDLGIFVAAGAALATTGSLAYADLAAATGSGGIWPHLVVGGLLLAAAGKSAQGLFAPWLFSAMGGPSSVSALLHSSTMVAAGAYLLIRLQSLPGGPVLDAVDWFAPVTMALGLATAVLGGIVAAVQTHAKKLLAASTSAHHGLMFLAVGAGWPFAALAHLVVHAVFKAQLFLAAGTALEAAATPQLGGMRLGRALPGTAVASLVGALSLAAVVPLGGAWSKEQVVAAAATRSVWLAAATLFAGALSAVYATRFQVLAFGRPRTPDLRTITARPGTAERVGLGILAVGTVLLSALWVAPVRRAAVTFVRGVTGAAPGTASWPLPEGHLWELAASIILAALAVFATWNADRRGHLGSVGSAGRTRAAADWLGIPALVEVAVVRPTLALATTAARFDDRLVDGGVRAVAGGAQRLSALLAAGDHRVVDAGVRAVAALGRFGARVAAAFDERGIDGAVAVVGSTVSGAARDLRGLQTGMIQHYYAAIAVGLVVVVAVAAAGR